MQNTTITMIDYGASNLRSAQKAFEYIGATVVVTEDPEVVRRADKLVLPGVGAFGSGMDGLRQRDLPPAIHEAVNRGILFLGICVGMQLLFSEGHEMGIHAGLNLIPGKVVRFNEKNSTLKIPHMGWNQLEPAQASPLLHGIHPGDYTYFVHSFTCQPDDETVVLAWTEYGHSFASVVGQDNIYGLQFHPEKSQKTGLQIIRNFVEMDAQ